jgi:uncharacterized membrane protein
MNIKRKALGIAELIGGLILISPADEAIFSIGTGGLGLAVAPAQLPLTAAAGYLLALDGIRRINK